MPDYDEYYRRVYAPSPEDISQPYEPPVPVISTTKSINLEAARDTPVPKSKSSSSSKCLTPGQFCGMVIIYVLFSFIHVAFMYTHIMNTNMVLSGKFYDIVFVLTSIFGLFYLAISVFVWGVITPLQRRSFMLFFCRLAILKFVIHLFELNIPFL